MRRRPRHFAPQEPPPGGPHGCDHPGCTALGEYRAPRGRDRLHEHYWFCLEHVREYNAAWDYYRGLSPADIERLNRADLCGNRPTWPLGHRSGGHKLRPESVSEAFRAWYGDGLDGGSARREQQRRREQARREAERARGPRAEALAVLELPPDSTPAAIKARWKQLVKLHHPDANGGDKAAEERLKSINQAYSLLKLELAQAG